MRRYAVGFVGLISFAVLGATSLGQSTPRAHTSAQTVKSTVTVHMAIISTTCRNGDRPRPMGCTWVEAGTFHSSAGVDGVIRADDKVTGHPSPNTYTDRETVKDYTDQGTITGAGTGKWTIHPKQNRKTFSTQSHVTGGTGAFKGASGTVKCSGSRRVVRAMPYPFEPMTCISTLTLP